MSEPPIRVLLVDDAARFRAAYRKLLDRTPGFTVAGEAGNGADAVRLARGLRPDVVLMDVQMPGTDGLTALPEILAGAPGTKVIVLTLFDLSEYVHTALTCGASGFLLKNAPPRDVLSAIRTVHAGHAILAPEVTGRLLRHLAGRAPQHRHPFAAAVLSAREIDVVRLVARGHSNRQIAETLFLSPETVRTYLRRLFLKLDVRDRTQLAVLAHEAGLLHDPR